MTISIFPRIDADVILDFRLRANEQGAFVPALVQVDITGKEIPFGRIVEIRDGGGHVELHRSHVGVGTNTAFDADETGLVLAHP